MIDQILSGMKLSVNWWLDLLSFMTNPTAIITTFVVASTVSLFFVLRWQLVTWGRMWAGDGIFEIMFSGFVGAIVTMVIYLAPLVLWLSLAGVALVIVLTALEKLVAFSVRN